MITQDGVAVTGRPEDTPGYAKPALAFEMDRGAFTLVLPEALVFIHASRDPHAFALPLHRRDWYPADDGKAECHDAFAPDCPLVVSLGMGMAAYPGELIVTELARDMAGGGTNYIDDPSRSTVHGGRRYYEVGDIFFRGRESPGEGSRGFANVAAGEVLYLIAFPDTVQNRRLDVREFMFIKITFR